MIDRPIPSTGERLPVIGLGTWSVFDVRRSDQSRAPLREVLRRLVRNGARLVDSSPMYGAAEGVVGDLQEELGLRPSLFLATKVWTTGREAGLAQMERSMRLLRTTQMDLMQVHNLVDVETHLRTLAEWKAQGRVRYVGVTHYTPSAHAELERVLTRHRLDFVQLDYSITDRAAEERLLPLAAERGVAVIANRPLETGALFDRVRGKALPPWAGEIGCASWAQVFLKFVIAHPAVTCAIPATSDPDHLDEDAAAAQQPLPTEWERRRMAAWADAL